MKRATALGLVALGAVWSARAASEVTVLLPVRSFQIQGLERSRLNDVAVYNGNFFLLLKDPSGSNEILRVDENGDILAKIPLPSTQMFKQLSY